MSRIAKKLNFKFYTVLPPELRILIVNGMSAAVRNEFRECSEICEEEVKTSINFVYGLKILANNRRVLITILNDVYDENHEKHLGESWLYEEDDNGAKYVTHYGNHGVRIKREKLNDWVDVELLAALHFEKLLQLYQRKIKCLSILGLSFADKLYEYDFGIRSLKRLKKLECDAGIDISAYLSKIRQPLEELVLLGFNDTIPDDYNKIFEVTNTIFMPNTVVSCRDLQQLDAPTIDMSVGNLTEIDISNFIKLWKNGILQKKVNEYTWWHIKESNCDMPRLFRMFGANIDVLDGPFFELDIKQEKESGKCAKLEFDEFCLKFRVTDNE